MMSPRRISRSSHVFYALWVSFSLLPASPAVAATFEATTLERLVEQSDQVALGTVLEITVHPEGPAGLSGIHTRVRFGVREVLVGQATSEIEFWVHGGRLGDRLRLVSGQATFSPGEQLVLFLFRTPSGALFPAGMARGKWAVRQGEGDLWVEPTVPLDASHLAPAPFTTVQPSQAPIPVSGGSSCGPILLDELRTRIRSVTRER